MLYTINELYHKLFHDVLNVYEIFQNFFGEEYTDLQGIPDENWVRIKLIPFVPDNEQRDKYKLSEQDINNLKRDTDIFDPKILVWWPRVTVSNENDRSVEIQDLYAQVKITMEGTIPYEYSGFQLCRTTFTTEQWNSHYIHSHVPRLNRNEIRFHNPCLGTGPIRHTIADLHNGYEDALWMLFCQELSLYVTVESLRGGPYIRMEEIGALKQDTRYSKYTPSSLTRDDGYTEFISYYLRNGHLALNYRENKFTVGMSYFDFMVDISNAYIEYHNIYDSENSIPELFSLGTLNKVLTASKRFYEYTTLDQIEAHSNEPILTFKGEPKYLNVIVNEAFQGEVTILLSHEIAMFILDTILKIINYRYNEQHANSSNREQGETPTTYQKVLYL